MSDRKLSEDLRWEETNAKRVEQNGELVMLQAHVFGKWADRAAVLEAENERLRTDAERYASIQEDADAGRLVLAIPAPTGLVASGQDAKAWADTNREMDARFATVPEVTP